MVGVDLFCLTSTDVRLVGPDISLAQHVVLLVLGAEANVHLGGLIMKHPVEIREDRKAVGGLDQR